MDNSKLNQEFKVGDTVRLISGGPIMTVGRNEYVNDFCFVDCQWFAGEELKSGSFSTDSLIRVDINEEEK